MRLVLNIVYISVAKGVATPFEYTLLALANDAAISYCLKLNSQPRSSTITKKCAGFQVMHVSYLLEVSGLLQSFYFHDQA